jgi:hypothetical protein
MIFITAMRLEILLNTAAHKYSFTCQVLNSVNGKIDGNHGFILIAGTAPAAMLLL